MAFLYAADFDADTSLHYAISFSSLSLIFQSDDIADADAISQIATASPPLNISPLSY
jgi:hypothetical protein